MSPSVFRRYDIVSESDLRDAARRLDGVTATPQARESASVDGKTPRIAAFASGRSGV